MINFLIRKIKSLVGSKFCQPSQINMMDLAEVNIAFFEKLLETYYPEITTVIKDNLSLSMRAGL